MESCARYARPPQARSGKGRDGREGLKVDASKMESLLKAARGQFELSTPPSKCWVVCDTKGDYPPKLSLPRTNYAPQSVGGRTDKKGKDSLRYIRSSNLSSNGGSMGRDGRKRDLRSVMPNVKLSRRSLQPSIAPALHQISSLNNEMSVRARREMSKKARRAVISYKKSYELRNGAFPVHKVNNMKRRRYNESNTFDIGCQSTESKSIKRARARKKIRLLLSPPPTQSMLVTNFSVSQLRCDGVMSANILGQREK
mmetsp:Transcript_9066/g.13597  ORF Transcript_9066/g.13597 Transcript_9066/m.13597 type:complete len:255 (+) Transcript_9066:41-805(+)